MSFSFFNPYLLLGLVGIALPILIHLLSRKNVTVIEWGAMQFLELGKRTRRKYQLEHLLLLLLRILLIAFITMALARPWLSGFSFGQSTQRNPRAIAIVIDCSFSMNVRNQGESPFVAARRLAGQILEEAQPGDQFSIIAAHDIPRPLLAGWSSQPELLKTELRNLDFATGSSNIPAALLYAVQSFQELDQTQREILVLSDHQAASWHLTDEPLWKRLENSIEVTPLPPRLWSLNLPGTHSISETSTSQIITQNYSLTSPSVSRQTSLIGHPVHVTTAAHYWGTGEPQKRTVHFNVDGQRLEQQSQEVVLVPDTEIPLHFNFTPSSPGSHIISLDWERDELPGDDRVSVAINLLPQLSVLCFEPQNSADPVQSESYYLQSALKPSSNSQTKSSPVTLKQSPIFFQRETLTALSSTKLEERNIICLANPQALSSEEVSHLKKYVQAGGSLVVLLGDKADATNLNQTLFDPETGICSFKLNRIEKNTAPLLGGIHIDNESLKAPFLEKLKAEQEGGFTDALFTHWWSIELHEKDSGSALQHPTFQAQLETGDPWLLTSQIGKGRVAVFTTSLNTDWNNLPSKPDFVPFVYELIFSLINTSSTHNISPGQPIYYSPPQTNRRSPVETIYEFQLPNRDFIKAQRTQSNTLFLDHAYWAGDYFLHNTSNSKKEKQTNPVLERYVVPFDAAESNPTKLSIEDVHLFEQSLPWQAVDSIQELTPQLESNTGRSELTRLFLVLFVILLLGEQFLTHYLVKDAHHAQQTESPIDNQEVPS